MVRQVRFKESSLNATGIIIERNIFGFGSHPLAAATDYPVAGQGQMATASVTQQKFRIIVDELLVGNAMEEIQCRAVIDSDAYDTVPLGATPDDVAKCSVAKDVLKASCPGTLAHAMCICKLDGGCGETAKGEPVGIADVNQDGAADDTRFIAGAAGVRCGSIDVPMKLDESYYNPSGDQNKPAMGGFDALGPAIVIVPETALPVNLECGLTFAPDIVDKQNNQICIPAGGEIANDCTPGDVSAFKFKTVAMKVFPQSFADGGSGVSIANPVIIGANAPLAMASLGAITVTQNGTPVTTFTAVLMSPQAAKLTFVPPLLPTTPYEIHVGTGLTDTFNQPLVTPVTFTFTTGS